MFFPSTGKVFAETFAKYVMLIDVVFFSTLLQSKINVIISIGKRALPK
jgi:hypothetical protein